MSFAKRLRFTFLLALIYSPISPAITAPEFSGTTLSGNTMAFTPKQRSKPAILVVWASWCGYCMAELPELIALHNTEKDNIDIIGINVDKTPAKGLAVKERHDIPYPSLSDPDLIIADLFSVRGTPDIFLVNHHGLIIKRNNRLHKIIDDIQLLIRQ